MKRVRVVYWSTCGAWRSFGKNRRRVNVRCTMCAVCIFLYFLPHYRDAEYLFMRWYLISQGIVFLLVSFGKWWHSKNVPEYLFQLTPSIMRFFLRPDDVLDRLKDTIYTWNYFIMIVPLCACISAASRWSSWWEWSNLTELKKLVFALSSFFMFSVATCSFLRASRLR